MKKIISVFCFIATFVSCVNAQNVILISSGEKIMIEASDGKALISDAGKTFNAYIDPNFEYWRLNRPSPATPETLLDVREITSDGTFDQIFTGITSDLNKLVMTQAQIISFCEKYPAWLSQSKATFFLTKVNSEYFVVLVGVAPDGPGVHVLRFEDDFVWLGDYRRRVVVPQLIPLDE